jgi:hypothetical protein
VPLNHIGRLLRWSMGLSVAFQGSRAFGSRGRRKANDQQIAEDCRSGLSGKSFVTKRLMTQLSYFDMSLLGAA